MTAEQAEPSDTTLREAAAMVLSNWRAELRAEWGAWQSTPLPDPELQVGTTEVELRWRTGEAIAAHVFERTAAGAEAAANALMAAGLQRPIDLAVTLEEAQVLRSHMRLPRVSRSAIGGAVAFELERVSPVPVAELYFDFAVARSERDKGRLEISARAVRRRAVENALSFAHMAGLSVNAFILGKDSRSADWRSFPLDRAAVLRRGWREWGHLALAGLAGLLFSLILLAAAARMTAESDALSDEIGAVGARAAIASRLSQQIEALHRQAALVAARRAQPTLTSMLRTLSQVLPDGTWVASLQFSDDNTIHLQGFSRSAADLPGILDRTPEFAATRFVAPLMRNDADGTERFDLTARVRSGR